MICIHFTFDTIVPVLKIYIVHKNEFNVSVCGAWAQFCRLFFFFLMYILLYRTTTNKRFDFDCNCRLCRHRLRSFVWRYCCRCFFFVYFYKIISLCVCNCMFSIRILKSSLVFSFMYIVLCVGVNVYWELCLSAFFFTAAHLCLCVWLQGKSKPWKKKNHCLRKYEIFTDYGTNIVKCRKKKIVTKENL